jgi:beta-lactamase regulating signal transducer with metallopeptidase domain
MGLGVGIFLIAVGAILKFAVADAVPGVALSTIGVILMIVGVVGLVISLFTTSMWSRDRRGAVVEERRVVERDPYV